MRYKTKLPLERGGQQGELVDLLLERRRQRRPRLAVHESGARLADQQRQPAPEDAGRRRYRTRADVLLEAISQLFVRGHGLPFSAVPMRWFDRGPRPCADECSRHLADFATPSTG